MNLSVYVNHPGLSKYFKMVEPGEYLFRQGEMGETTYLIIDGMIQLYDEEPGGQHLVGTFGPGQFFGEKTLLGQPSFQRFFSAISQMRSTILEFSLKDIPHIQKVVPEFMLHMFQSAAQRLDRAYYLIRILRSDNDLERLVHCILYFYRCPGLDFKSSQFIPLTVDDIHYLIRMDRQVVTQCLDELVKKNILVKRPNDCYLLRDEKALLRILPSLEKGFSEKNRNKAA